MTSYSTLIESVCLSCIVLFIYSELFVESHQLEPTSTHFHPRWG